MSGTREGPLVSVIVPLYDAEPFVGRCLEGLAAQTLPAERVEVLVVDNNSTDEGPSIVQRQTGVRLLRETRQGAYAARNLGLAAAHGELVAFTDPDCVPEEDWLERLIAPFGDPEVQVVNGRVFPAPGSRFLERLAMYEHHRDLFVFGSSDPLLYFGHTNNLAARRSALDEAGGFMDRARGSDAIFVRQVTERHGCGAVRYSPDARVVHLEMDGLAAYFRKGRVYRESRLSYSQVTPKRSPGSLERMKILKSAYRSGDMPWTAVPSTLAVLTAATLYRRIPLPSPAARPAPSRGGAARERA